MLVSATVPRVLKNMGSYCCKLSEVKTLAQFASFKGSYGTKYGNFGSGRQFAPSVK